MRRLALVILVIAIVIVAITLAALLSLRTKIVHDELASKALPPFSKIMGGAVKVGSYEGSLLHDVTLHDVEFDDPDGHPLIRAKTVWARYDWRNFVKNDYRFDEVRVTGAWITFALDAEGRLALAALGRGTPKPPPPPGAPYQVEFPNVIADVEAVVPERDVTAQVHLEGAVRYVLHQPVDIKVTRALISEGATRKIEVAGAVTIKGRATQFDNITLDVAADSERLLQIARASAPVSGPLTLHASLDGTVEAARVALDLGLARSTANVAGTFSFLDGTGDARGQLALTLPRAPIDQVKAAFTLKSRAPELTLTLSPLELDRRREKLRARSPVFVTLDRVQERLRVEMHADLDGNPFQLHADVPIFATARARAVLDGKLSFTFTDAILKRVEAAMPDVADRLAWLDRGKLDASFKMSGTLGAPLLSLDGNLALGKGNARFYARYEAGRSELHLDAADVATLGRARADVTAQLPLSLIGWHLQHGRITSAPVAGTVELGALEVPGGSVDAQIDLSGVAAAPVVQARASFSRDGKPLAKVQARADFKNGVQYWKTAPLSAQLTVEPRALPMGGILRGSADLQGTVSALRATAELHADGIQLGDRRFDGFALNAALDGSQLTLQARDAVGHQLSAAGTLQLSPHGQLQLDARIDKMAFDLSAELLPTVRTLKGTLDGELHLAGTVDHPHFDGHLQISDGFLALRASAAEFRDLTLDAKIHDGELTIDRASVKTQDGSASVSGSGSLQSRQLQLHLDTHHFPISQAGLDAWIDSRVDVEAHRDGALNRISVSIADAQIDMPAIAVDHPLQSTAKLSDVVYVEHDEPVVKKAPPPIALHLATVNPVRVRSPEAKVDVSLLLDVAPVHKDMIVRGHIDGSAGEVTLLGRHYQMSRMHVTFTGAPDPDPTLDIQVKRPMRDVVMLVDVTGTGKNPRTKFRSSPPRYSEAQVLGEFIAGDPEKTSITSGALDHQVIGVVSGLVIGDLKDSPAMAGQMLKIEVGNEGYGNLGGSVETGRFITDNLYLTYLHQFGSAPVGQVMNHNEGRLDLRFKRKLLLESHFGDSASGGIDVFWTKRF